MAGLVAVLVGGIGLAVGVATEPAGAAQPVDFSVTFTDLAAGESRSEVHTIELARDSTLEAAVWEQRTGLLSDSGLTMTVCQGSTCVASESFASTAMSAGDVQVEVSVDVPGDAPPATSGTALGRLTFVATDDRLATSGADVSPWVITGGLLLVAGAALALGSGATRRRGAR